MIDYKIRLTIDTAKELPSLICDAYADVDLMQGRYVVDAKSSLGIFSLDLTKEITMRLYTDNVQEQLKFEKKIKHILVK